MKRRQFLTLVGAAAVWPASGSAQPAGVTRVGVLVLGNPDPEPFMKELREGLRELGYVEGQNIQLELRSAKGKQGDLTVLAAELVGLKVDMLIGFQTPPFGRFPLQVGLPPMVFRHLPFPAGAQPLVLFALP